MNWFSFLFKPSSQELALSKKKIVELENRIRLLEAVAKGQQETIVGQQEDIADLLEQLSLGLEKPSPPDIVKLNALSAVNTTFTLDFSLLNIPFTKPAKRLVIMGIPNTGSMDGAMDYGHNNLYLEPADEENHKIMVDWIAKQWQDSQGMLASDCVYRVMVNPNANPKDFSKPDKWYAIHRLIEVGNDSEGRYFWFGGINNQARDPFPARDVNILWLNIGTIF